MLVNLVMSGLVLTITVALAFTPSKSAGLSCLRGHKVHIRNDGSTICEPCDSNTYMSENDHSHTHCYPCTTVKDNEILRRECSSDEDALIGCLPGFYRQNQTCKTCTRCEHAEVVPCQYSTDAECCNYDTYYVTVNTDGSRVCKVRTLPCRNAEYYNTSAEKCKPCQNGTSMTEDHHNNTACYPQEGITDQPNKTENETTLKEECPYINTNVSVIIHGVLFTLIFITVIFKKCKKGSSRIQNFLTKLHDALDKFLWFLLFPCVFSFIFSVLTFIPGEVKIIKYFSCVVSFFVIIIILIIAFSSLFVTKRQQRDHAKDGESLNPDDLTSSRQEDSSL